MGRLQQPDQRTCGASVLVVAAALVGSDVRPGVLPALTRPAFVASVLATHRRTAGLRDRSGRWQLPWPRALGTSPWGLARELDGAHRVHPVLPSRRAAVVRAIRGVLRAEHPVPLYVGNVLAPAHVVLVLAEHADGLAVYDPARGAVVTVGVADLAAARLPFGRPSPGLAWAGAMRFPWCAVLPVAPPRPIPG